MAANWPVPGSPFAVRVTGDNIGDAFVPTGIDQLDNFGHGIRWQTTPMVCNKG